MIVPSFFFVATDNSFFQLPLLIRQPHSYQIYLKLAVDLTLCVFSDANGTIV